MRSKSFIAACGLLVALLAAIGGIYVYDQTREDTVAKGLRVGGVNIGGLSKAAAERRLEDTLLGPLNQPLTVDARGRHFTLTPEQARVGVDINGSVAAAITRSRSGNLLSRTVRDVTGGKIKADLPVDVTYDTDAVDSLVKRVERTLERPAVDAKVDFEGGMPQPRPSQTGIRVQRARLKRDIGEGLTALRGDRMVGVVTKIAQPRVTTDELAKKYPAVVIVDRNRFRLTLYKDLKRAKTYPIAVGQAGLETPAGLYHVQNKAENPAWHVPDSAWAGKLAGKVIPPGDPQNPIEARWMGIFDGAGIHGTTAISSLGTAASHGCVRMAIPDVIELYDQVPVQSPVYVI